MTSSILQSVCYSLLVLGVMQVFGVAATTLSITPGILRLSGGNDTVNITCTADTALTACQVMWFDSEDETGPLIDLSKGNRTYNNYYFLGKHMTFYDYYGRGLEAGDCGITMDLHGWKSWIVGCRVRAAQGGWKYAWMDLFANTGRIVPITVTPREAVVLPGQDAVIMCASQVPLGACQFKPPGEPDFLMIDHGPRSDDFTGRHIYHGAGLQRGQCGLRLLNVTDTDNGPSRCSTIPKEGEDDVRYIPIIVARAPRSPVIEVVNSGSNMTATCFVRSSRPVANITWLLGDTVIRQDDVDDAPADLKGAWRWPWDNASITQTLTRTLEPEDRGKLVKCRVTHVALARPLEVAKRTTGDFGAGDTDDSPGVQSLFGQPDQTDDTGSGCPPLMSSTLVVKCHLHGNPVNCLVRQQVGAEARLSCKQGHVPATNSVFRTLVCREDDTWNRHLYACIPDCGRRNSITGSPLISGGVKGTVGEFPWHVAVYYHETGSNENPEQICGGTLITPNIAISAAHCFFNELTDKKNVTSEYKVAAGKLVRQWQDSDPMVQKRDLLNIYLLEQYHGRHSNFASDIAVLRVATAFQINTRVNTACVDWDTLFERSQLRTGSKGIVAGWGFTAAGVQSDILQHIDLPYIQHETCYDSLSSEIQHVLTNDKFCAGFINQSKSVCGGDSGGGMVFQQPGTGKYYLRGVVSVAFTPADYNGPVCYDQHYGGFTLVSSHIRWINDLI